MKLTITHNRIIFVDAQAMRLKHTETFEAPSIEDLNEIHVGDHIKICIKGERFWVQVTGINGEIITGRVDNDLLQREISYNDTLEIPKNAIHAILKPSDL